MRRALPLVLVGVMSTVLIACGGGGSSTDAGQSGLPPIADVTTTTSTTVAPTETSIPEEVIDIPDISDLGLTYDGEVVADEVSGDVVLSGINAYLISDETPPLLQPAGTFDPLEGKELSAAVDAADAAAPQRAVALFLGLTPDGPQEMLIADHGRRVIVVDVVEDDSVRAVRYEFNLTVDSPDIFIPVEATTTTVAAEGDTAPSTTTTTLPPGQLVNSIPYFLNGLRTQQCQPGRGHQDFTPEPCV